MLIEFYLGNYNTSDGLVNGYGGIFKDYTNHNNLGIMWIKCNDSNFGHLQRLKYAQYYKQCIDKAWTPIVQIARPIQIISTSKKLLLENNFQYN